MPFAINNVLLYLSSENQPSCIVFLPETVMFLNIEEHIYKSPFVCKYVQISVSLFQTMYAILNTIQISTHLSNQYNIMKLT